MQIVKVAKLAQGYN